MSQIGANVRIIDIAGGPTVLYDGDRIVAQGSRKMCEAIRDGTLKEYLIECEDERRRLGIGLHSTRAKKQLVAEAPAATRSDEQVDLFA